MPWDDFLECFFECFPCLVSVKLPSGLYKPLGLGLIAQFVGRFLLTLSRRLSLWLCTRIFWDHGSGYL